MDGKKEKEGMALNIFESLQAMLLTTETEKKQENQHENKVCSGKTKSLAEKLNLKLKFQRILKWKLGGTNTNEKTVDVKKSSASGSARETDNINGTNVSEKEFDSHASVADSIFGCDNDQTVTSSDKLLNITVTGAVCHGNSENVIQKSEVPNVSNVAINADQIHPLEEKLEKSSKFALHDTNMFMKEFAENKEDKQVTITSVNESEIVSNTVCETKIPGSKKNYFRVGNLIESEKAMKKVVKPESQLMSSRNQIITGSEPESTNEISENQLMDDIPIVYSDDDALSNCSGTSHYSEGVDVAGEFEFDDGEELHSEFENNFYDEDEMCISKEGYKSYEAITVKQTDINSVENQIQTSSLSSIDLQEIESSKVSSDGVVISSSEVVGSDVSHIIAKQGNSKSIPDRQIKAAVILENQSEIEMDSTSLPLNSNNASSTISSKKNSFEIKSRNLLTNPNLPFLNREQGNVETTCENISKLKEGHSKMKPTQLCENHQTVMVDRSKNLSSALLTRSSPQFFSGERPKVVKISIHSPQKVLKTTEIPVHVNTCSLQTPSLSSSYKPIADAKRTEEKKESRNQVGDLSKEKQLSEVGENNGTKKIPNKKNDISTDTIVPSTVDVNDDQSLGTNTNECGKSQKNDQHIQKEPPVMKCLSSVSDVLNQNKELVSREKMATNAETPNCLKGESTCTTESLMMRDMDKSACIEMEKNDKRDLIEIDEEMNPDDKEPKSSICLKDSYRSLNNKDVIRSSPSESVLSPDKSPSMFQQKNVLPEKERDGISNHDPQNPSQTKFHNSTTTFDHKVEKFHQPSSKLTVDSTSVKSNMSNLQLMPMTGELNVDSKQKHLPQSMKTCLNAPCVDTKRVNRICDSGNLPIPNATMSFDGEFFVGKMKGAFICLKCRSKFYEVEHFRHHLWQHIHHNALRCSYCSSTDPKLPCKTTDSVLGLVLQLKDKKIFSVKPKRREISVGTQNNPNGTKNQFSSGTDNQTSEDETEIKKESDSDMDIKIVNTFSMSTGETLSYNFSKENKLTEVENEPGGLFRCSICNVCFLFAEKFNCHLQHFHKSVTSFKCHYCGQNVSDVEHVCLHYFEHINSSFGLSHFECPYPECLDKTNMLEKYLGHMRSHRDWKPICCQCEKVFENIQLLSDHYRQNLFTFFSCSYCNAKAVEKRAILNHLSHCHHKEGRMMVVAKMLVCANPGTKVNSEFKLTKASQEVNKMLEENQENLKEEKPPSDEITLSSTSNEKELLADTSSSEFSFSTFMCQKCSFVCNDKRLFLHHKKVHFSSMGTNERPLSCPLCPTSFDQVKDLSLHLNYHDRDTEFSIYQCPVDGYFTNDKQKGKLHIAQSNHTDTEMIIKRTICHKNKIFHCSFCKIAVQDLSIYKRHLSIHGTEGEREAKNLNSKEHNHTDKSSSVAQLPPENSTDHDSPTVFPEIPGNSLDEVSKNTTIITCKRKLGKEIFFENSVPYVMHPYNLVIEANDTYKNSMLGIEDKFQKFYTDLKDHFICAFCEASFQAKNLLYDHLVEHLFIPYQCSFCHIQMNTYNEAVYHVQKYHKVERINVVYSVKIIEKINRLLLSMVPSYNSSTPMRMKKNAHKIFMSVSAPSEKVVGINQLMEAKPKKRSRVAKIGDKHELEAFLLEQETTTALDLLITKGIETSWCKVCGKVFSQSPTEMIEFYYHLLIEHIKYHPLRCSLCSFRSYFNKLIFHHYKIKHPEKMPGKTKNIMSAVIEYIGKSGLDIPLYTIKNNPEMISEDFNCETISSDSSFNVSSCNSKSEKTIKNTRKSIKSRSEEISEVIKQSKKKKKLSIIDNLSTSKGNDQEFISPANIATGDDQLFKCRKCDFVTEKKHRAMQKHFKTHSLDCFVQCFYCSVRYTDKKLLERHSSLIHKGLPVKHKRLSIMECFQPVDQGKKHEQVAEKNIKDDDHPLRYTTENMICLFCNMEEANEDYMRYHLNLHLGYTPFVCGVCKLSYSDPFQQKQHIYMDHNGSLDKSQIKRIDIYEKMVDRLLEDCKKILKDGNEDISWNLEEIKLQLSRNGEKTSCNPAPKVADSSSINRKRKNVKRKQIHSNKDSLPIQRISTGRTIFAGKKGDVLETTEEFSQNHVIEINTSDNCNNNTEHSKKRKHYSQCTMDSEPFVKKIKISSIDSETSFRRGIPMVNEGYTSSLIEINNVDIIPDSPMNTSDCSGTIDVSVKDEFHQENILCYFCDYSSQALAEVMSHTQQEHVGRNIVALLWIDKLTGGTYDHQGHMFLNDFDSDISIAKPFLCTRCSYRSENYEDVLEHVEEDHDNAKSTNIIELQKSVPSKGSRGQTPSRLKKPRANGHVENTSIVSRGIKYSCNLCTKICSSEYTYRCHLAKHENYSNCSKPDLINSLIQKHQQYSFQANECMDEKSVAQFKCYYCPYKANSVKAVKVHQHRKHPNKERNVIGPKLNAPSCHSSSNSGSLKKYACGNCDFSADSTRAVKLHYRAKHPDKERKIRKLFEDNSDDVGDSIMVNLEPKYACGNCDFSADSTRAVKLHYRAKHPDKERKIRKLFEDNSDDVGDSIMVNLEPKVMLKDLNTGSLS